MSLRSTIKTVLISTVIVSIAVLGMSTARADTVESNLITVNGAPLSGSTQASSSFTASVSAPSGTTEVKFVLDGVYLGQTTSTPFRWQIHTTLGNHVLDAHWDTPVSTRIGASFTVGTSATSSPTPSPTVSPTALPSPSSSPSPSPTVSPSPSPAPTSTGFDLQAALAAATPGSTVTVPPGTYFGNFVASPVGTATAPITLSAYGATINSGGLNNGMALKITGSYWVVEGISTTNAQKGILLDGSQHTVLDHVTVYGVGDEGVHFRHNSSYSVLQNSVVHDTGLLKPGYGECSYIGTANSNWTSIMGSFIPDPTDYVTIQNNHLYNCAAEGTDIKEGTVGGQILNNVYDNAGYSGANYGDSWLDVKGNNYTLTGNSGNGTLTDAFQDHQVLAGWGDSNYFANNTVLGGVPGYLYNIQSTTTGNVLTCQTTLAALGEANIACTN